jgi:hypothetical protein
MVRKGRANPLMSGDGRGVYTPIQPALSFSAGIETLAGKGALPSAPELLPPVRATNRGGVMDEITRLDRIDALADRLLKTAPLDEPATDVWDRAAEIIDERERQRLIDAETCRQLREGGVTYAAWGGL